LTDRPATPAAPSPGPWPPSEVHVFVDDDGQVTFSDLPADLAEVAAMLDPEGAPACALPARGGAMTTTTDTVHPVRWDGDAVVLLDQRLLPAREVYVRCGTPEEVAAGIRDMVVRGAPAIGVAAAYGVAAAALRAPDDAIAFATELDRACGCIADARPTAVNLHWAVDRMRRRLAALAGAPVADVRAALLAEAVALHEEDVAMNRAMGRHGAALIPDGATVMTHCNAGALATGGYGTALGVIRGAREAGKDVKVISCETRPYLQGARLTAWELVRDGFDVTLITDNAAGSLMARGLVTCVIVGADRIAANGDTANKIGTYVHAVLAARHGIPFYVAAPSSTLDPSLPDGSGIPIEQRPAAEVLEIQGHRVAAEGVKVINPSFDVTPWSLITAIVTERGVHRPGPDGYGFTR
jgi:methylthioribose-1-phosphate isomerase